MSKTTILKPNVKTVKISPNPVNQNKEFKISIKVIEELIVVEQVKLYCGMLNVGQKLGGVI